MEDFVKDFNEFRDWLYESLENAEYNSEDERVLNNVLNKFEELNLHNVF